MLLYADVVLICVSRTFKTPVSMYLAHKRTKAATVPIVPEVEPPTESFKNKAPQNSWTYHSTAVASSDPSERLKALGLTTDAEYASMNRIQKELAYADRLLCPTGCPVIDVSNKAIEATASMVLGSLVTGGSEMQNKYVYLFEEGAMQA